MSSTNSYRWINTSTEDGHQLPDLNLLSPRSSFSSQQASGEGKIDDYNSHKRNLYVHLHPGAEFSEDDPQSLSVQTLREGRSIMGDPQPNVVEALEERIRSLESRLTQNGFPNFQDPTEDSDGMERSRMSTEPQWLTWHEYCKPLKRASNILEVLTERPHSRRKLSDNPSIIFQRPIPNPLKNVKRIRIRSHHIINVLQIITEHAFEDMSCLTLHRPFKILLFYQKEIEAYLTHLEHTYSSRVVPDGGDQCQGPADLVEPDFSPNSIRALRRRSAGDIDVNPTEDVAREPLLTPEKRKCFASYEGEEAPAAPRHSHHELSGLVRNDTNNSAEKDGLSDGVDDSIPQEEAIQHLSALVTFMKEDMGPIFERHRLLRSSKAVTVYFEELWHLFMPGDLVVGDDEKNPRLYRVSIIPPSDRYSRMQIVKEVRVQSDSQVPHVEATQRKASIQCFNIDVFHFDYDGTSYGPVESRVTIIAYEGEKNITDLPFYPVRFRKDASTYKANMAHRGARFMRLCTETTAHREYEGLSVDEPQEHIDSQVITDGNLAYRMHPEKAPKFGLRSWMESNARVMREACDIPGCNACSDTFKHRLIFDDHRADRRKTFDFIRANRSLLRTVNDSSELTEDLILLLPNCVQGFVLGSRRWYYLNLANLRPITQHTEGFESLILPDGVARLVEGLVQTHDPQNTSSAPSATVEQKHQVDLVRGKGKGLIILLHGPPGVGKTSTAECVADYTKRRSRQPLFPITCGDIGETAKEVEANLKQNFDLAHRWGCVLLLDEADVFLQARDKEDMRRNSVVSVFLRVLEYYSGILILTTNKVGHFDEAFSSRIHVSLYYPPLSKRSSLQIWKMNLSRLIANRSDTLVVHREDIENYAKEHYKDLRNANRATWNGRQIKNAFQTAIALAEFDNRTRRQDKGSPAEEGRLTVLRREHFEVVAKASEGFDDYLCRIHGPDGDRARRAGERDGDDVPPTGGGGKRRSSLALFPLSGPKKPTKAREDSSDSSSSDDQDPKDKKRHKKDKKAKKYAESSDSSSSEDEDEKEKKRRKKEKKAKKKAEEAAKLKEKLKPISNDSEETSSSE